MLDKSGIFSAGCASEGKALPAVSFEAKKAHGPKGYRAGKHLQVVHPAKGRSIVLS